MFRKKNFVDGDVTSSETVIGFQFDRISSEIGRMKATPSGGRDAGSENAPTAPRPISRFPDAIFDIFQIPKNELCWSLDEEQNELVKNRQQEKME